MAPVLAWWAHQWIRLRWFSFLFLASLFFTRAANWWWMGYRARIDVANIVAHSPFIDKQLNCNIWGDLSFVLFRSNFFLRKQANYYIFWGVSTFLLTSLAVNFHTLTWCNNRRDAQVISTILVTSIFYGALSISFHVIISALLCEVQLLFRLYNAEDTAMLTTKASRIHCLSCVARAFICLQGNWEMFTSRIHKKTVLNILFTGEWPDLAKNVLHWRDLTSFLVVNLVIRIAAQRLSPLLLSGLLIQLRCTLSFYFSRPDPVHQSHTWNAKKTRPDPIFLSSFQFFFCIQTNRYRTADVVWRRKQKSVARFNVYIKELTGAFGRR